MRTQASPVTGVRETTAGMRAVFLIGSILVTAAGIQLFVLADRTDRIFAWTIKNPLTAAFLGAFYFTALVLAALSARERIWIRARVGVFGVFVFVTLTFVLTLLHLGLFHFHAPRTVAKGAAYLWFAVYMIAPIGVAVAWAFQVRTPGTDPPRQYTLPAWYRALLAVHASVTVLVGIWLFVAAPAGNTAAWPWTLTPLTARAVAAWLIGLGLVLADAVVESAWERIRSALAAYVALGVLEFAALARYPHAPGLDWGAPKTWVYIAFLATVLFIGAYGWKAVQRALARGVPEGDNGQPGESATPA